MILQVVVQVYQESSRGPRVPLPATSLLKHCSPVCSPIPVGLSSQRYLPITLSI